KRQVHTLTNQLYGANPRQAAETARSLRQLSTDTTMTRTQAGPPVAWIWTGVAVLAVLLISLLIWVVTIQPGSQIPANARIVPNVVDMSWDRAAELLTDQDLLGEPVEESSEQIAEGNVVRTDPAAGTSVERGQKITVYVSTGQEMATVPPLINATRAEAVTALQAAGLALGAVTSENHPDLAADTVMS